MHNYSCLAEKRINNRNTKNVPFSGKEFEVLIDSHGPEHVTQLMQKVISALEHLEKLSGSCDAERETIENLRTTISHLELEDTKKKEETQRNAKVCLVLSDLYLLLPKLSRTFLR